MHRQPAQNVPCADEVVEPLVVGGELVRYLLEPSEDELQLVPLDETGPQFLVVLVGVAGHDDSLKLDDDEPEDSRMGEAEAPVHPPSLLGRSSDRYYR
ncbi:MAG: hypothetical protein JWM52_497 [Candidatus Saccharibacteria bacterium]|nr:hypothetical protein [Candidatus Saccharibacteria bacterium]